MSISDTSTVDVGELFDEIVEREFDGVLDEPAAPVMWDDPDESEPFCQRCGNSGVVTGPNNTPVQCPDCNGG